MPAPPYYADVVSCKEHCAVVCNHNVPSSLEGRTREDGSKISIEDKGWIPRGTTTRATLGNLDLMWILINPGNPQKELEHNFYSGKAGAELADAAWAFTERVLEGKEANSLTLRTTYQDITRVRFGDGDDPKKALDRCMVTNVVRCSTPPAWGEAFKGLKGETAVRRQVVDTCFENHLRREIEYWKPKTIIAVGEPVGEVLGRINLEWEHSDCGIKSRRTYDKYEKKFVCLACKQYVIDWGFIAHPAARKGGASDVSNRSKNLDDLRDSMRELWD